MSEPIKFTHIPPPAPEELKAFAEGMVGALSDQQLQAMREGEYGVPPIWNVFIDLAASPQNVPFEVALAYLKAGRRVKRSKWPDRQWMMEDGRLRCHEDRYVATTPSIEDLMADDWCVIKEWP